MLKNAELANAIRVLSMDAVQSANSGHPGMPMGMADIAEVLWRKTLKHNPTNQHWFNRDRFVVSNGHGSMLLYSLLHLTGYEVSVDDLKAFRQLHSKTPGHPEFGITPGVETTTGPLGQGIANAVGMALAEKLLAHEFNKPDLEIVDHNTFVFMGDGCLMEGLSHEVCSLAGTLKLGKLIVFYDDNGISIDSEKGNIKSWFSEDVPARFESYGWRVIRDVDGHDRAAIEKAINMAMEKGDSPTLVCCKTRIGRGAPNKENTGSAHGAPLGPDEIAAAREAMGWEHPPFEIPQKIYEQWDAKERGKSLEAEWAERFSAYERKYPALAGEFKRRMAGNLPEDWQSFVADVLRDVDGKAEKIATRKASQNTLEILGPKLPELLGGSADLAASNLTMWGGSKPVEAEGGNYIFYGVREFGMAAVMNGVALHGGLIPYGATFLVFSDYCRNALRVAALMGIRSVFVFTHDSIGLGEDGPTHQPVEHAASLRIIPNLDVWRPCDTVETLVSWTSSLQRRDGPSCLLATRQGVPHQTRTQEQINAISKGAYVLSDSVKPQAIILATGSEVTLAMRAKEALAEKGIAVRVVSVPSTTVFDRQPEEYKNSVLLKGIPRVAVEAGVTDFWRKYVGTEGAVIGVDRFGESAPADQLFEYFGITAGAVEEAVLALVSK